MVGLSKHYGEVVAVAGRAACDAIEAAIEALEVGARARTTGVPLVDIVDDLIGAGGRDVRLATADAFHEFERALVDRPLVAPLRDMSGASEARIEREDGAVAEWSIEAADGARRDLPDGRSVAVDEVEGPGGEAGFQEDPGQGG